MPLLQLHTTARIDVAVRHVKKGSIILSSFKTFAQCIIEKNKKELGRMEVILGVDQTIESLVNNVLNTTKTTVQMSSSAR